MDFEPECRNIERIKYWLEDADSPFFSDVLPPDKAPNGNAPVGVRPFSCNTDSDSSLCFWGIGYILRWCFYLSHISFHCFRFSGGFASSPNIPQHGENARHLADGPDLVADHFLAQIRCLACGGSGRCCCCCWDRGETRQYNTRNMRMNKLGRRAGGQVVVLRCFVFGVLFCGWGGGLRWVGLGNVAQETGTIHNNNTTTIYL